MPRKMAGIEMITIDASIVAIVMPSVVLDRATHLYRSPARPAAAVPCRARLSRQAGRRCPPRPENRRTSAEPTADQLLDGNYLLWLRPAAGRRVPHERDRGGNRQQPEPAEHRRAGAGRVDLDVPEAAIRGQPRAVGDDGPVDAAASAGRVMHFPAPSRS